MLLLLRLSAYVRVPFFAVLLQYCCGVISISNEPGKPSGLTASLSSQLCSPIRKRFRRPTFRNSAKFLVLAAVQAAPFLIASQIFITYK